MKHLEDLEGAMKIHQTPASTMNSVPFLHSRKFYAVIIDAWVSLCTVGSACRILKALLTQPLRLFECNPYPGYFGPGLAEPPKCFTVGMTRSDLIPFFSQRSFPLPSLSGDGCRQVPRCSACLPLPFVVM